MSEQDQGFTVKDRRIFREDGSPRAEDSAPTQAAPAQKPEAAPQAETGGPTEEPKREPLRLPPVDFSGLILSLSHAAALHLGLLPDEQGQARLDPALARHTIDTIAMLKDKTQGNLTPDEERLITGVLTELRLAFVQATK
ncbi:MAG: DUF1844 domain-containing protein [Desulfarculus sp.]|nr:DUF1844 domain-containing protein [Desulfarculus sp.]